MGIVWQNEGTIKATKETFSRCIDCHKGAGPIDSLPMQVCGWIERDNGAASIWGLTEMLFAANGRRVRVTVELL